MPQTITANMVVKNGMPFVIPVVEQVLPFMDKCLISYNRFCTDSTRPALEFLERKHPDKIKLFFEEYPDKSYLTIERGRLLGRSKTDWILFLDADDWWSTDSLKEMMGLLDADVDAWAFNPYQIVDRNHQDGAWWDKWFSKLFRNKPGVHYEGVYPKENIYIYDKILWWKKNHRVKRSSIRYFHLSNLMEWRFRNYTDYSRFKAFVSKPMKYKEDVGSELDKIFSYVIS